MTRKAEDKRGLTELIMEGRLLGGCGGNLKKNTEEFFDLLRFEG
jgi:hypothetical protein